MDHGIRQFFDTLAQNLSAEASASDAAVVVNSPSSTSATIFDFNNMFLLVKSLICLISHINTK